MGRYTTGATSTEGSIKLSIKFLKEQGILIPNQELKATITYSNRGIRKGGFQIVVNATNDNYIRLIYTHTTYGSNEEVNMDYKIYLEKVPSNLGKGFRYYFLCPVSGRRCETLYQAYGSHFFKSRLAYSNYIYYPSQLLSHRDRVFRYHGIKDDIEILRSKQYKYTYKGKKTRLTNRIELLEEKYERVSNQSLTHLWRYLQKMKGFLYE